MVCVIWIVWEGVWGYGAGMDLIGRLEDIPVLEAGQVVVWGAEVSVVSDALGGLYDVLSEAERLKAERLRSGAREVSVVARGGLRVLLGAYAGVAADAVAIESLASGKPVLEDGSVAFSVAHSGEWVVWAFARGGLWGWIWSGCGARWRGRRWRGVIFRVRSRRCCGGWRIRCGCFLICG